MADYIYSIILLIISLISIELKKSYQALPKAELRKRARADDQLASKIYSAVAYEQSLEILLWLIIIICSAGSIFFFYRVAPLWFGFIAVVLFLAIAFAWLPKRRMDSISQKLAVYITPLIVWLLNYLHPIFKNIIKYKPNNHTGLYDKQDLIKLIDLQKNQTDSKIAKEDLDLIKNGLKLADKTVGNYCISWSKIHHTLAHEAAGPILLDELHKSGQLYIPVLEDNQTKKVIGMINTGAIDIAKAGLVKDLMDNSVHYLNEDDSLLTAIKAITLTGSPVFVVLDKKQQPVGLITIKDIIGQLVNLETTKKPIQPETDVLT